VKRELSPKVTEGLFFGIILFLTIPPSRLREPPPFTQGRLITARPYAKGVRTNRPYSFCCRAGVHLPPLSSPFSLVFGGSKPPPYDIMGRKNLLYGKHCACSVFFVVHGIKTKLRSHSLAMEISPTRSFMPSHRFLRKYS